MSTNERSLISRFAMEVVTGCIALLAGIVVVLGALEYEIGWDEAGPQPGYFPFYVGLIIIVASLGVLVQGFLNRSRTTGEAFLTREGFKRVMAFFLPLAAFTAGSYVLGLYVGTFVYLAGVMIFQGGYRWPFALTVAGGITVFFFVLFERWFQVPLLKGPLEAFLGIY
ncbi:tripartite tricarboxylate transporter TctB family protein [Chelatococcus composti]|jgi:hypothetical protein|uniref:DUF1468 domain-containing protein n=1 Tax=Chelatococcus composti TaxID=1743235 RepID=A0A841KBD8_9HYPH|nr:tripartite tricarboxylate transporter TctB family protein [Chelatococcus composti]MBB6169605.1 hypothetical protein [Chelatococcus composti]MBS7736190.1 tripartite tricarboxylate transporter TctB family protein [Chelatococcus composti]PZN42746.1 MAG: hypothetical protein DIU59_07040 [Pseudomonadota bacterium]GGG49057.1 hypothetical protein GCM10008026_32880 [Chelatococcus composti]